MKYIDAQNLENRVKAFGQLELFFDNGYQYVNTDRNPDLSFDRIDRVAQKTLDAQMTLDPFEKEFDLPTALVKGSDGWGGQGKVVRQKDQRYLLFDVVKSNAPQLFRIILSAVESCQGDRLIASDTTLRIDGMGVEATKLEIAFGSDDEEGHGLLNAKESSKVQVSPVHNIKGSGFEDQFVDPFDFVLIPLGDRDEAWNRTSQIQQSIEFDGGFGRTEMSPRKQCQTQIDSRSIQSIGGGVEFDSETVLTIQSSGFSNQDLSQFCEQSPISSFAGICQCAARDATSNAQMVKLFGTGTKTGFHVSQALPISQLSESQTDKLIPTGETPNAVIGLIFVDQSPKIPIRQITQNLGKNKTSVIHPRSLSRNFRVEKHSKNQIAARFFES